MNTARTTSFLVIFFMALSFMLHSFIVTSSLFSLLPVPVVLSSLLTFTITHPLPYLIVLAVGGELYSHLTPGMLTLISITPWLLRRVFGNFTIDLSLSWLSIVALTIALQLTSVYVPDLLRLMLYDASQHLWLPYTALAFVPWIVMLKTFVVTTSFVYVTSVFLYFRRVDNRV